MNRSHTEAWRNNYDDKGILMAVPIRKVSSRDGHATKRYNFPTPPRGPTKFLTASNHIWHLEGNQHAIVRGPGIE